MAVFWCPFTLTRAAICLSLLSVQQQAPSSIALLAKADSSRKPSHEIWLETTDVINDASEDCARFSLCSGKLEHSFDCHDQGIKDRPVENAARSLSNHLRAPSTFVAQYATSAPRTSRQHRDSLCCQADKLNNDVRHHFPGGCR